MKRAGTVNSKWQARMPGEAEFYHQHHHYHPPQVHSRWMSRRTLTDDPLRKGTLVTRSQQVTWWQVWLEWLFQTSCFFLSPTQPWQRVTEELIRRKCHLDQLPDLRIKLVLQPREIHSSKLQFPHCKKK